MSRKTTEAQQKWCSYELEVLAVIEAVKKFRTYLLGNKFKLVTDCKALTMTLNKKELVTRVARWSLLLEEFQYEVEHRAGTKIRHVDALSRNATALCVQTDETMLIALQRAQKKDEKICAIIEVLKRGAYKDYIMQHDILTKNVNGKMLYVVPDAMKTSLIRAIHEEGHFHHTKMKKKIEEQFYINDLKKRIDSCIASCISCILSDRKGGKQEGLLNPIPKGDRPLETFHIDHLGPMSTTKKDYKYILALIDGFSKFCWLFPTKSLCAEEVIKKCEVVASTFGYPSRIIADRGGAFTSTQFRDYCRSHDTKFYYISAGVPRGNGQVERLHSTVISVLTKLSLNEPAQWYKHVSNLQRILNNTFHRAIQMTPFELVVGTKMKTGTDRDIMKLIELENIQQFENERNELREKARLNIAQIQAESKRNFDRKRKEATKYKIDDLIAIERTQFGTGLKIKPKFLGPYKVKQIKGFDRYVVEKVGKHEGPGTTTTSGDKMKYWEHENDEVEQESYDENEGYETRDEEGEAVGEADA